MSGNVPFIAIEYANGVGFTNDKHHMYHTTFDVSRFVGTQSINSWTHLFASMNPFSDLNYAVRHLRTELPIHEGEAKLRRTQIDTRAFARTMLNNSCRIVDAKLFASTYNSFPAFRNLKMIEVINANCTEE
jgi:hypothetical protein